MGKILVVEDEDRLRLAITAHLKSQGADTLATATAQEAMSTLEKSEVDLVVLDWNQCDGQSLSLLRHIRGSPALANLPVIVVSAWDVEPVSHDILEPGDYLLKPFDIRMLDWMIRQLLGLSQDQDLGASLMVVSPETPSGIRSGGEV